MKKVMARAGNVINSIPLFLGWILHFDELAEPENGIQRGTQFVTHARNKFTLRLISLVRFFLGFTKGLIGFLQGLGGLLKVLIYAHHLIRVTLLQRLGDQANLCRNESCLSVPPTRLPP